MCLSLYGNMVSKRSGKKIEAVIFRNDGKAEFLILHRNEDHGGFWQTLTGNVEDNESLTDALIREIREETGIDERNIVSILDDVYSFSFHAHGMDFIEYVYAVQVKQDTAVDISRNVDNEHDDYGWFTYDDAVRKLKWDSNVMAIEKTMERIGNASGKN